MQATTVLLRTPLNSIQDVSPGQRGVVLVAEFWIPRIKTLENPVILLKVNLRITLGDYFPSLASEEEAASRASTD